MPKQVTAQQVSVRLQKAAGAMSGGDEDACLEGLHQVIDLLREIRYKEPDFSQGQMTLIWILRKFVLGELYRTFGPASSGIPETEGKAMLFETSKFLGDLIRVFFAEERIDTRLLGLCLDRFQELCRVCETALRDGSTPSEEWGRLVPAVPSG